MTPAALHPRVAVLLPAYQAAEFIQPTLDSISAQTFGDLDVIVSVDASSDETYEICSVHAARDRRFRVFRHAERLGYVGNCNHLLSSAASEFALFAFHDDLIASTYVEKLLAALEERPDAVISYSDVEVTQISGAKAVVAFDGVCGVSSRVLRGLKILERPKGWWAPNRGVFRMSATRRIGGFKLHAAGEFMTDWPWLFHLSLLGQFVRVPETLCFKYFKPESISKGWAYKKQQIISANVSCMREIWNSDLSDAEKMQIAKPLLDFLLANTTQERPATSR